MHHFHHVSLYWTRIILYKCLFSNEFSWNCHSSSNFDNQKGFPKHASMTQQCNIVRSTFILIVSSSHTGILRYFGTCPYMNPNVGMAIRGVFFSRIYSKRAQKLYYHNDYGTLQNSTESQPSKLYYCNDYGTLQKASHPSYITAITMVHYRKPPIQVILLQWLWNITESQPSKLYYCNDYGTSQKANHPSYITATTYLSINLNTRLPDNMSVSFKCVYCFRSLSTHSCDGYTIWNANKPKYYGTHLILFLRINPSEKNFCYMGNQTHNLGTNRLAHRRRMLYHYTKSRSKIIKFICAC